MACGIWGTPVLLIFPHIMVQIVVKTNESLKEYLKSKHDNQTTRPVQEYEKNRQRLARLYTFASLILS